MATITVSEAWWVDVIPELPTTKMTDILNCRAEDAAATNGTWPTVCDNPYLDLRFFMTMPVMKCIGQGGRPAHTTGLG